jgi:acyl dehydratase
VLVQVFTDIAGLSAAKGQRLGESEWLAIEQPRIDAFADATGDDQWIHVDAERAKDGPFGATIAHGYLTLSLIPGLTREIFRVDGATMAVNYGVNKVRFISPVRVGSKVRAVTEVADAEPLPTGIQMTFRTTIELDGGERPACVAEHISRYSFPAEEATHA